MTTFDALDGLALSERRGHCPPDEYERFLRSLDRALSAYFGVPAAAPAASAAAPVGAQEVPMLAARPTRALSDLVLDDNPPTSGPGAPPRRRWWRCAGGTPPAAATTRRGRPRRCARRTRSRGRGSSATSAGRRTAGTSGTAPTRSRPRRSAKSPTGWRLRPA